MQRERDLDCRRLCFLLPGPVLQHLRRGGGNAGRFKQQQRGNHLSGEAGLQSCRDSAVGVF